LNNFGTNFFTKLTKLKYFDCNIIPMKSVTPQEIFGKAKWELVGFFCSCDKYDEP
jgi:hypothetical protein